MTISDALVPNTSGSLIFLRNGILLLTVEVLDPSSLEKSSPLPITGVNAHNSGMTDLIDVMAHLRPLVNVLDYPETQPALLQLLAL